MPLIEGFQSFRPFPCEDFTRVSIYDQKTHIQALSLDLQRAKLIVIIVSPYLQMDNIIRWQSDLESLIARGIRVCIRVDLPEEYYQRSSKKWLEAKNQKFRDCVALLEKIGCHVTVVANVHTKLVIIDYHILWEGSLNFLSSNPDKKAIDERVPRVDDLIHAMNAYSRHNCDQCQRCLAIEDASVRGLTELTEGCFNPSLPPSKPAGATDQPSKKIDGHPLAPTRFARVISKLMAERRRDMSVTKTQLAEAIGISRPALEMIENGKSTPSLKTFAQLVHVVGWKLVIVPDRLVPFLNIIVKSYHRAAVSRMVPPPSLVPRKTPIRKIEVRSKTRTAMPRQAFPVDSISITLHHSMLPAIESQNVNTSNTSNSERVHVETSSDLPFDASPPAETSTSDSSPDDCSDSSSSFGSTAPLNSPSPSEL